MCMCPLHASVEVLVIYIACYQAQTLYGVMSLKQTLNLNCLNNSGLTELLENNAE